MDKGKEKSTQCDPARIEVGLPGLHDNNRGEVVDETTQDKRLRDADYFLWIEGVWYFKLVFSNSNCRVLHSSPPPPKVRYGVIPHQITHSPRSISQILILFYFLVLFGHVVCELQVIELFYLPFDLYNLEICNPGYEYCTKVIFMLNESSYHHKKSSPNNFYDHILMFLQ